MPKGHQGQKRPADSIACAVMVAQMATAERDADRSEPGDQQKKKAGALARNAALLAEKRSEIAEIAAQARWRGMEAINASQLATAILGQMNGDLSKQFGADVIFIKSPMRKPLDSLFRIEVETIRANAGDKSKVKSEKLCILLETPGGYIETVKRLVDVMRRHYKHVSFVIPDYAYSAGMVLALSGDEIFMDYYSILGPIDPQVPDEAGGTL